MLALERADLVRLDERQPELALLDPLAGKHYLGDGDRLADVQLSPTPVRDLDVDHPSYFRRCVPVSSACSLYASTIR